MEVKIKKLNPNAVLPKKAHPTDAGFDLVAVSKEYKNGCAVFGTGLAFEIPVGYVGLVFPRSSIANTCMSLTNAVGCIDAGYRGEVMAKFKGTVNYDCVEEYGKEYSVGDRIGQLIIMPIPDVEFVEADELSETDRGTGGYGSSGN